HQGMTYYEILGVHRKSTLEELKEARRQAALAAHPDRGGSEERMALVNEAFEVLSDRKRRKRYEIELAARGYTCPTCEGEGVVYRRKGWTARELFRCAECSGAGVLIRSV